MRRDFNGDGLDLEGSLLGGGFSRSRDTIGDCNRSELPVRLRITQFRNVGAARPLHMNKPVPGFRVDMEFTHQWIRDSFLVKPDYQVMLSGQAVAHPLLFCGQVPASIEAMRIARG